uniref:Ig-like domain-containing protein n=1 Tax=Mola mola TaxID=94237 RepID=A0A3Q3WHN3_MOLML
MFKTADKHLLNITLVGQHTELQTSNLLCPTVKHSLTYFLTATSGAPKFPYNMKVAEAKQDWMRMLIKYEPQNLECKKKTTNYIARCVETPRLLSLVMASVSQVYDVEDFIVLDLDYGTHKKARLEYNKNYYIRKCPYWLKKDVQYERSVLKRAESLLSSPVSCHATSFYPNRAPPLRRKDGDDLHENVDHGEILPNPDGTFQMSVDLNLSSVKPEDWGKYDCLFQICIYCLSEVGAGEFHTELNENLNQET